MTEAALGVLLGLIDEVAFETPLDRACCLAGLMSAVLRPSMPTCPLFVLTAAQSGVGKSYLADLIATVGFGQPAGAMRMPTDSDELDKMVGGLLESGTQAVLFDNIPMGDGATGQRLCQLSERETLQYRVLGRSQMRQV